jgi:hypothetical protein
VQLRRLRIYADPFGSSIDFLQDAKYVSMIFFKFVPADTNLRRVEFELSRVLCKAGSGCIWELFEGC